MWPTSLHQMMSIIPANCFLQIYYELHSSEFHSSGCARCRCGTTLHMMNCNLFMMLMVLMVLMMLSNNLGTGCMTQSLPNDDHMVEQPSSYSSSRNRRLPFSDKSRGIEISEL